jgi:hypothetical protein
LPLDNQRVRVAQIVPTSTHRRLTLRSCRSTCALSGRPSSIQSYRLNESLVNMRNVRTSLLVGVLLVELVFGVFLLSHKSRRPGVDTDVATNNSAEWIAAAAQVGDTHVSAGSVIGATPLSSNTTEAAAGSGQLTGGAIVAQSAAPARDTGGVRDTKEVTRGPRPDTRLRESVAFHSAAESKTGSVPRTDSRRDSLHRHGWNPVAAALTDELVKESAKLDPSLPPPAQPSRSDPYRPGSNPVAAAMTDQLVRESTKLDPALPPPDPPEFK